jgi:hypothetical protein
MRSLCSSRSHPSGGDSTIRPALRRQRVRFRSVARPHRRGRPHRSQPLCTDLQTRPSHIRMMPWTAWRDSAVIELTPCTAAAALRHSSEARDDVCWDSCSAQWTSALQRASAHSCPLSSLTSRDVSVACSSVRELQIDIGIDIHGTSDGSFARYQLHVPILRYQSFAANMYHAEIIASTLSSISCVRSRVANLAD